MAIELRSVGGRAVILPEQGGRLHQLFVAIEGGEEPLLFSPASPADHAAHPMRGGSFPMAPWPNRIRDGIFQWAGQSVRVPTEGERHANHGRVLNRPWEVIARTARVVELSVAIDGWPWPAHVWQRYEITPAALRMKMEVRSEREAFPAGCGWHPWFRREVAGATDVRVTLRANQRYVLNGQLPPGEVVAPSGTYDLSGGLGLGERRLDDCYTGLTAPVEIDWGRLCLKMTVDSPQPHVMVHTPSHAFCIEPQSCAPDAFNLAERGLTNTGAAIARPGRPVAIASRWEWEVR